MKYATGEQPQVGDRVTFIRVNGQPQEGVVTKLGITGLFARIVFPSTSWLSKDGMGFISGIVPLVSKMEPVQTTTVLNMIDADGVRQEQVIQMAAGVNSVVLSGRIDTDLEDLSDPSAFHLQMFPGLDFWIAEGLAADIQANDEVIVMGTLKTDDHPVVFVDQVVKVAD